MINDVSIIKKRNIVIWPDKGFNATEQLKDCLINLDKNLDKFNTDKYSILKQHIFLKEKNKNQFYKKKRMLSDILYNYYEGTIPPTSIIAQANVKDSEIVMEITFPINDGHKIEVENKLIGNISYKVIRKNSYKEVFACGLGASELSSDIHEQSEIAFSTMKAILKKENLDFSAVVRQWNYIENILKVKKRLYNSQQNYQIFNDVRSKYYENVTFINGYPSATGIGMDTGGVVIDFIASLTNKNVTIKPVKNPVQIDAHKYSNMVLIGNNNKTSPKFERAKSLFSNKSGYIYISGTAAIRGEENIGKKNIIPQVSVTIENIRELISIDNLKKNGVPVFSNKVIISSLRVYIKNKSDVSKVVEVCERNFPEVSKLFLIADICRDSLLVEIEGEAYF